MGLHGSTSIEHCAKVNVSRCKPCKNILQVLRYHPGKYKTPSATPEMDKFSEGDLSGFCIGTSPVCARYHQHAAHTFQQYTTKASCRQTMHLRAPHSLNTPSAKKALILGGKTVRTTTHIEQRGTQDTS